MFEPLTQYIPLLEENPIGELVIDRENDGTLEHPFRAPYVHYSEPVYGLITDVHKFVEAHPEMGLTDYRAVIERGGLHPGIRSLIDADVSAVDGVTVAAILVFAVRAERFSDGTLLECCEKGAVTRWLKRLEELDREL